MGLGFNIMGLLSSSVSITRYKVEGQVEGPILETVSDGLKKNCITEIDDDASEKTIGWTSFDQPFKLDFEGSCFVIDTYLVFSLRIDKKTIPPKIIKKQYAMDASKRLAESGRNYLSRDEKRDIMDHVTNVLSLRIPATPNVYDLIWNYEDASLWFFSNLKSANEELESLFLKSFNLTLIRLFPYTTACSMKDISDTERDFLSRLMPTKFTG